MLKKLRLKFVLVNMAIVVAMLLVIFVLVYHSTGMDLAKERETTLESLIRTASQTGGGREFRSQLPYFVVHINARGIVSVSGVTTYDLQNDEFVQDLIELVLNSEETMGLLPGYSLQFYQVAYKNDHYLAFVDTSNHNEMLRALVETCGLIGGISILAFLGISVLLAHWAVKPVEQAWRRQKQFVSDASHELKTPLTVIMSNAELLQGAECDALDKDRYAGNIMTMSYQMRDLVEGMLELARADDGKLKQSFEKISLSKLTEEALLPFEPVFFEKGILLQSNIAPEIALLGNRKYLQQVVDILLDNACKYSAPGIVTVELRRHGSKNCLLMVANPGEPIPKQELNRIFERFYRIDQARSRTGSFGLGLSIAKSTVEAHGGKIWAESNQTGNRFCVQLPVVQ